jgi:outer membrane protein assembly factor BamB
VTRFLTVLSAAVLSAAPPEWPQFRGPLANPSASDPRLPDKWSLVENLEWTAEIPGRAWSSPIVSSGRVYLTTAVTEGKSKPPQTGVDYSNEYMAELKKQGLSDAEILQKVYERDIEMPEEVNVRFLLYCLDLKTGAPVWKTEYHAGRPPGGRHRKNSFASETPVTDGRHIYVYATGLGLFAFDLKGKLVWKTPLEPLPMYLDLGAGASPVLHGNAIVIVHDNQKQQYLAAYDKRTGRRLWRTDRKLGGNSMLTSWSTPFVWSHPLRTEIVTLGPAAAVSYDLEGKELWRLSGIAAMPIPSAFAHEGILYINGGPQNPVYAIKPGASGDISLAKDQTSNEHILWAEPRAGTSPASLVLHDGGIYSLTERGIVARLDLKTGKASYKSRLGLDVGYFTSTPWAYNGRIFYLNEEGKTYVTSAGERFELLHTNELAPEMTQASPAIAGDRLLIRTESRLYSIRRKR